MRPLLLAALPAAACAAQLEVLSLLNWQRLPVGDRGMAEGGAVVARIDGPAAGYANPAGLADLARPTVSGTVDVVEYTRVAARTPGGTAEADDLQLKPNMVGFANALDDDQGGWAFTLASPLTWSSGLEVRTATADGERRDDGRSTLEMTAVGLSWGRRAGEALRLGGAIEVWLTDYRYDAGSSARDANTVLTATYTERGRQVALRAAAGAQWQRGAWRAGALLRTPGLAISGQGAISGSSTGSDGASTVQNEISEDDAAFAVPLPWQVVLAGAWLPPAVPGLELELDLAIHGGSGEREVFPAVTGTATTVGAGAGTAAFTQDARRVDLRPVLNPRLGLRYRFPGTLLGRAASAHLGGYVERSPVDASDVFSQLDLLGGTAGLSLEKGPMLLTVAAAYVTSGTLQDAIGYVASPGAGLNPELSDPDASYAVRTFTLSIGSSYRF